MLVYKNRMPDVTLAKLKHRHYKIKIKTSDTPKSQTLMSLQ